MQRFSLCFFVMLVTVAALSAEAPKPLDSVAKVDELLAAVKGTKAKVVLLNMWGITCSPCIAEMPILTRAAEKFKDNPSVAFIGLCIPEEGAAKEKILEGAAAIVQKRQMTYRNLVWTGTGDALLDRFKIDGTPYTIILSADGKDLAEVKNSIGLGQGIEETIEKERCCRVGEAERNKKMTNPLPDAHARFDPYFSAFLTAKLHQPLLPKLRTLSATFQIELLGDTGAVWTLAIKNGMLDSIASGAAAAQCGFKLKPEIFAAIVDGTLSPQWAFFKRQVEIDGDIVLGLKLATVLAEFFKRFPWRCAGQEN